MLMSLEFAASFSVLLYHLVNYSGWWAIISCDPDQKKMHQTSLVLRHLSRFHLNIKWLKSETWVTKYKIQMKLILFNFTIITAGTQM